MADHAPAPTQYPPLFVAADAHSRAGRHRYIGLVRIDLLLIIAASAAGVVAAISPALIRPSAVVAAVFILGAVTAKFANRHRHFDRYWFNGRAVAESVKTATWRYMMRLSPYDTDGADATFARTLAEILRQNANADLRFPIDARGAGQVTAGMRAVRDGSLAERKGRYLRERVVDQLEWYAARAVRHRRAATGWYRFTLTMQWGAIVSLLGRAYVSTVPNVSGLALVVAAAATAWNQLRRNDEVSKTYGSAAQDLAQLRDLIASADDEATFGNWVRDAEETISREHTRWAAKRG